MLPESQRMRLHFLHFDATGYGSLFYEGEPKRGALFRALPNPSMNKVLATRLHSQDLRPRIHILGLPLALTLSHLNARSF